MCLDEAHPGYPEGFLKHMIGTFHIRSNFVFNAKYTCFMRCFSVIACDLNSGVYEPGAMQKFSIMKETMACTFVSGAYVPVGVRQAGYPSVHC